MPFDAFVEGIGSGILVSVEQSHVKSRRKPAGENLGENFRQSDEDSAKIFACSECLSENVFLYLKGSECEKNLISS